MAKQPSAHPLRIWECKTCTKLVEIQSYWRHPALSRPFQVSGLHILAILCSARMCSTLQRVLLWSTISIVHVCICAFVSLHHLPCLTLAAYICFELPVTISGSCGGVLLSRTSRPCGLGSHRQQIARHDLSPGITCGSTPPFHPPAFGARRPICLFLPQIQ